MAQQPFDYELENPVQREQQADISALDAAMRANPKLMQAAMKQRLANLTDDELKGRVSQYVDQEYGNLPVEYRKAKAQQKYKELKDVQNTKYAGPIGTALDIAVQKGATAQPDTILPTQEQVTAINTNKRWTKSRLQVIQDLYREGKLDDLVQKDFFATQKLATQRADDPQLEAEITGRMQTALMGAPDSGEGWGHSIGETLQKSSRFLSGATAGVVQEYRERKKAADSGQSVRADEPLLRAAWENANKAATEPMNSASQLSSQLQLIQNDVRRQQIAAAQQDLRRDPFNREAIDTQAQRRYDEETGGNDLSGYFNPIRHPVAAQLVHEIVADPLVLFPGEDVAKGVMSLGRKAGITVPEGLKFAAEYTRMQEQLPEATAIGQLSAERAVIEKSKTLSEMAPDIHILEKVPAADREVLGRFVEGQWPADKVPKSLRPAYEAAQRLQVAHAGLLERTGQGNKVTGGIVQPLEKLDAYMPHRVLANPKAEPLVQDINLASGNNIKDLEASAASSRTSSGKQFSLDPAVQWKAELRQLAPDILASAEIKQSRQMFTEAGLWHTVDAKDAASLPARKAELQAATNVPWVEMPQNMAQEVDRITGIPGVTKVGDQLHLVPVPVAQRYETLFKATRDPQKSIAYLTELNQQVFQPLSRAWKSLNSLSPMSIANNVVGNIANGYLAKGFAYFNPKTIAASAGTVLLDAIKQSQLGEKVPFTLRGGTAVDMADLLKMAHEDGILGQYNFKLALQDVPERTKVVGRVMNFGADVVQAVAKPARALNELGDDFHKLNIWMSSLHGIDPVSRANAAQTTAKLAGNYRRLGQAERYFRDFVPYYGWLRHVTPFVTSQVLKNPSRTTDYFKLRTAMERSNGAANPTAPEGIPDWLQGKAVTAPYSRQPKELIEMIRTGQAPPIGSHEAAMLVMQDPINMGLWYIPMLEAIAGVSHATHPEVLANLMGPFNNAVLELLTGTDMHTGTALPDGMLRRFGFAAKQIAARPFAEGADLVKLYSGEFGVESPEAQDVRLRYAVGRYFMGLDNWIAPMMDMEPRSVPSYLGGQLYLVDSWKTGLNRKAAAVRSFPEVVNEVKQ